MINLIPPKIKRERRNKAIIFEITGGIIAVLVMFIIFSIALNLYNQTLTNQLKRSNEEIHSLNKKVALYKETEDMIKNINTKLDQIKETSNSRILWSTVLNNIGSSTPKNLQIKSLNANKNANVVSITGAAIDRKTIASMKEMLEKNNQFTNVTFSTSTYNQTTNDYTFSLSLEIKQTK